MRLAPAPWFGYWPESSVLGVETADMLVHEVLSRPVRDRRAVARYAGLTGRRTRAARAGANKGWPEPATPGSAAA